MVATLVVFNFLCVVLTLSFRTWLTLPDLGYVRACAQALTTLKTGRFKQPPKLGSVC